MTNEEFTQIVDDQFELCRGTLVVKAKEYATEDRLHNFRVAADLQNVTTRVALGGMLAKHIVSIFDMLKDEAWYTTPVWEEKIGDSINYLLLLKAVVTEEGKYSC